MAKDKEFASLGASASDLSAAWNDRLADAEALLAAGRHGGAISMAIYAIEILLKERICRILGLGQLPMVFQIHDLYGLATCAGLRSQIDDSTFKNSTVGQNWDRIRTASEKLNDYRYKPDSAWTGQDATTVLECLRHTSDGIFPWIQRQA